MSMEQVMPVNIGSRKVGPRENPYIIAEIGANHNGDMGLARELVDAAVDCGCDSVKFQLWDRHVGHTESYIQQLNKESKLGDVDLRSPELGLNSLSEQISAFQCDRDQHAMLKEYCDKRGVHFSSTALTESDVDFLVEIGVHWLKVASQDTDHTRFIKFIADKGMPTLVSTGISPWSEMDMAVRCFKPANLGNLVLLHCISLYPPADSLINLRKMDTMAKMFGVPIGYSDHSIGTAIPLAAIARGAVVIEKHFTLDKTLPGWDHKVSADPLEMRAICEGAKRIYDALGSSSPEMSLEEQTKAAHFRRSVVTVHAISAGDVIREGDLFFKRPGIGIRPYEVDYVVGRVAKRDIPADELVRWEDLV